MDRKKIQKSKPKSSDGRKPLTSVRVVQRNLVYIVGLPLNLADEDVRHFFLEKPVIISYDLLSYGLTGIFLFSFQLLQRKEYFGQYGKVLKVSMSRTATGLIQQFPNNTCSVWVLFSSVNQPNLSFSMNGFLICYLFCIIILFWL